MGRLLGTLLIYFLCPRKGIQGHLLFVLSVGMCDCVYVRLSVCGKKTLNFAIFIPPATKLGGVYWNHPVRPSVDARG